MAEPVYGSNIVTNPSAASGLSGWSATNVTTSTTAISGISTSFKFSSQGSLTQSVPVTGSVCAITISMNVLLPVIIPYTNTSVTLTASLSYAAQYEDPKNKGSMLTEFVNRVVPVVIHSTSAGIARAEFEFPDRTCSAATLTLRAGNSIINANNINVQIKASVDSLSDQIDAANDAIADTNADMITKTGQLYARIADTNGNVATITQTVDSLTSRIQSAEGNVTELEQTSTDFTFAFQTIGVDGFTRRGQTVINVDGLSVYNGALQVYGRSGNCVFDADDNGEVFASGCFQTTGSWGATKLMSGSVNFYTIYNGLPSSSAARVYANPNYSGALTIESLLSPSVYIAIGGSVTATFTGIGLTVSNLITQGLSVGGYAGINCETDVNETAGNSRRLSFKNGILTNTFFN